jgi:DNA-binding transcriptional LysR family regulator
MRQKDVFEGVPVFVTVAKAGSFSAAARRLGISPSAVSQAIGSLEQRLGTTLFRRSTRSLSLTDVGEEYLRSVAPALSMLRQASDEAQGSGGRPAGPLRLTMPRAPFELIVAPILVAFRDAYPGVELEVAVEARFVDIVKEGYDAGLRYGNCLEQDMVAVRVAPPAEAVLVASPDYLVTRDAPEQPAHLFDHHALMCRSQSSGAIIPWRLRSAEDLIEIVPKSVTVVHDLASQIALAVRGMGVLSAPSGSVRDLVRLGTLSHVLPHWSTPMDALYIYFPSRGHQPRALRVFIDFLKRAAEVLG